MDRDFLIDLFSDFGPVTIRRMFSGFGISADGINFALALRSGLYFRADAGLRRRWNYLHEVDPIGLGELRKRSLHDDSADRRPDVRHLHGGVVEMARQTVELCGRKCENSR